MPPYRVGFLRRFGLKTVVHFAHFGLESGMVFGGTTGVYKLIYRFISKWVKKEKGGIRNGFEELLNSEECPSEVLLLLYTIIYLDCEQSLIFLCKVTARET